MGDIPTTLALSNWEKYSNKPDGPYDEVAYQAQKVIDAQSDRIEQLEAALREIIKADRRCEVDMIEPSESTWGDGPSGKIARKALRS